MLTHPQKKQAPRLPLVGAHGKGGPERRRDPAALAGVLAGRQARPPRDPRDQGPGHPRPLAHHQPPRVRVGPRRRRVCPRALARPRARAQRRRPHERLVAPLFLLRGPAQLCRLSARCVFFFFFLPVCLFMFVLPYSPAQTPALLEIKIFLFTVVKSFVLEDSGETIVPVFSSTLQPRVKGKEDQGVQLPVRVSIYNP